MYKKDNDDETTELFQICNIVQFSFFRDYLYSKIWILIDTVLYYTES